MAQSAEPIYKSSNGDRWTLIRDTGTGRLSVRHEANPSSGGRVTETDVDEFLSIAGSGPEFAAHVLQQRRQSRSMWNQDQHL